jgi:hypothetical protein
MPIFFDSINNEASLGFHGNLGVLWIYHMGGVDWFIFQNFHKYCEERHQGSAIFMRDNNIFWRTFESDGRLSFLDEFGEYLLNIVFDLKDNMSK